MKNRFLLNPDYVLFNSSDQLQLSAVTDMDNFSFGCIGLMSFFYIPMTILIFLMLGQQLQLNIAFASEGRPVDATVLTCEMRRAKGGQYPAITYFYEVNGVRYEDSGYFDTATNCDFFRPETTRRAQYLPSNPQESRIIDYEPSLERRVTDVILVGSLLFVSFFSVLMLLAALMYPIDVWRYRRLKRSGVLLDGILIKAKGKIEGKHSRHNVYVTYRVETPNGRVLIRKQKLQREDLRDKAMPVAGTPVYVLYADDDAVAML